MIRMTDVGCMIVCVQYYENIISVNIFGCFLSLYINTIYTVYICICMYFLNLPSQGSITQNIIMIATSQETKMFK